MYALSRTYDRPSVLTASCLVLAIDFLSSHQGVSHHSNMPSRTRSVQPTSVKELKAPGSLPKWYSEDQLPNVSTAHLPETFPTLDDKPSAISQWHGRSHPLYDNHCLELVEWLCRFAPNAKHPNDPPLEEMSFEMLHGYVNFALHFYGLHRSVGRQSNFRLNPSPFHDGDRKSLKQLSSNHNSRPW